MSYGISVKFSVILNNGVALNDGKAFDRSIVQHLRVTKNHCVWSDVSGVSNCCCLSDQAATVFVRNQFGDIDRTCTDNFRTKLFVQSSRSSDSSL